MYTIGFSGLANSNKLSEFFRKQMALLWQPNVGKNKPKIPTVYLSSPTPKTVFYTELKLVQFWLIFA